MSHTAPSMIRSGVPLIVCLPMSSLRCSPSCHTTPASVRIPFMIASTRSPKIMLIRKLLGKGSLASGLFLSNHSWQYLRPMLDMRNLKSGLRESTNCFSNASLISLTIELRTGRLMPPVPATTLLRYCCTFNSCMFMLTPHR